jgi:hypothetical protein
MDTNLTDLIHHPEGEPYRPAGELPQVEELSAVADTVPGAMRQEACRRLSPGPYMATPSSGQSLRPLGSADHRAQLSVCTSMIPARTARFSAAWSLSAWSA